MPAFLALSTFEYVRAGVRSGTPGQLSLIPEPSLLSMAWWNKLVGRPEGLGRVEYYDEGVALMDEGKFHEALTSFRLALKEAPGDPIVLQQIAIAYTRIGMTEEAAKTYRHVLQKSPEAAGAHYGLAFLLVRSGQTEDAIVHLKAFLQHAPTNGDAQEHVDHARRTLARVTGEGGAAPESPNASQDDLF